MKRRAEGLPALPLLGVRLRFTGRARHSVRAAFTSIVPPLVVRVHVPVRDESRHSQIQRMAATMSATQLTPIGMLQVPTATWACLISRTR